MLTQAIQQGRRLLYFYYSKVLTTPISDAEGKAPSSISMMIFDLLIALILPRKITKHMLGRFRGAHGESLRGACESCSK